MKIAITGATGFIGYKLLLKHSAMGDDITILSRRDLENFNLPDNVKVIKGDLLTGKTSLKNLLMDAEVLYHCAAEIRDEVRMYDVNVTGTENLISAISNPLMRWVQLSSVGVYGPKFGGIVTENDNYNPANTYEKTKLRSDELVIEAGNRGNFEFAILRPSNVYGVGMKNQSLVKLINTVKNGKFFFIGPAGASANYIEVSNVVDALILCGKMPAARNKVYNISDNTSMENFIGFIAKALGINKTFLRIPLIVMDIAVSVGKFIPGFPLTRGKLNALTNRSIYINELLETELNYKKSVSIEDGITEMVKSQLTN